ncbi:hypothetical protein pb186bvf_019636 [Paramecium bursaria]
MSDRVHHRKFKTESSQHQNLATYGATSRQIQYSGMRFYYYYNIVQENIINNSSRKYF